MIPIPNLRQLDLAVVGVRVRTELFWSFELSEWLQENLPVAFDSPEHDMRPRTAMALCNIALEHRDAALALAALNSRGSMGSLLRSMLDAAVKARWCRTVAEQAYVARLLAGKQAHPTFKKMVNDLKRGGFLSGEAVQETYSMLSDYAHGEERQLSRWVAAGGVTPLAWSAEMVECLGLANRIGMMAALERELLCKGERSQAFTDKAQEVMARVTAIKAESQAILLA